MNENSDSPFGRAGEGGYEYNPYSDYSHEPSEPRSREQVIPLRPMEIVEQFQAAARAIGFNPGVILAFPFVIYLATAIIIPAFGLDPNDLIRINADFTMEMVGSTGQFVAYFAISYLALMVVSIMTINAIMAALFGRKLGIGESLKMAASDLPRFIVALVVYFALFVAAIFGLSFLFTAAPSATLVAIMILASLVLAIIVALRFSSTISALVAEQRGPFAAMGRSLELTKGKSGFLFATFLLLFVSIFVATFVLSAVLAIPGAFLPGSIVSVLSSAIISTITGPVAATVTTIVYINLRMMKEGFHRFVEEHD